MKVPWLLLQLADSALPTGGFAHSGGLEAAAQHGEVHDGRSLRCYLRDTLWQAGHTALPLVSAAHDVPSRLPELDVRADAFLANHVANRASRTQGRAMLDTCARIFLGEVAPVREAVRTAGLRYHHAPLFGTIFRALGIERPLTQQVFLAVSLKGSLFAAVRLGLCGTHEAQRLQHELEPLLDEVLASCSALLPESVAQTSPLADLLASTHDRLYSRLFLS